MKLREELLLAKMTNLFFIQDLMKIIEQEKYLDMRLEILKIKIS